VLRQVATLPRDLQPPVVSRLKVVAGLDIAEQRLPQEGRVTKPIGGRMVDFRVSSFPTVFGEKIAIRILEPDKLIRGLADLGLNRRGLALVQDLLGRSRGIILVTGPTGAGKTTTLYSALNVLGGRARNIMTVEDPVEYEFPAIRQTQVRPRAGLTFATAIRSLLRQDPDVIMIGEIRDPETAWAARAVLSGVLVFDPAHSSAGAVPCLMDTGIEPHCSRPRWRAIAQRLVRLVCPQERLRVGRPARWRVGLSRPTPSCSSGHRMRSVRTDGLLGRTASSRSRNRRRDARPHRRALIRAEQGHRRAGGFKSSATMRRRRRCWARRRSMK
jgi:type II secretory ATPase GspE/PulE/Tfp pilus assembly ATPase PilB-like protein